MFPRVVSLLSELLANYPFLSSNFLWLLTFALILGLPRLCFDDGLTVGPTATDNRWLSRFRNTKCVVNSNSISSDFNVIIVDAEPEAKPVKYI